VIARGASFWLLWPMFGVASAVALAAVGAAAAAEGLGMVAASVLFLFLFFFRDPERFVGEGAVSPADGRVLHVTHDERGLRIAIFMAPWSVHVNRAPLAGRIERTTHRRGGHRPAFSKQSQDNERLELSLSTETGDVDVALIAGTVARRVHPYVGAGDTVERGQRIGVIAFGSRCELRLPPGWVPLVPPGTWVHAGATTLARTLDV
jgi:phosphatidylserine decarboxylase